MSRRSLIAYQNVDSEVIFGVVDKMRSCHVLLHDEGPSFRDLTPLVDDGDAGAAGKRRRFNNPLCAAAFFLPNAPEKLCVRRQTECAWQKAEFVFSKFETKPVIVLPQSVLSANIKCALNEDNV